jgi:hypothetical protein
MLKGALAKELGIQIQNPSEVKRVQQNKASKYSTCSIRGNIEYERVYILSA